MWFVRFGGHLKLAADRDVTVTIGVNGDEKILYDGDALTIPENSNVTASLPAAGLYKAKVGIYVVEHYKLISLGSVKTLPALSL